MVAPADALTRQIPSVVQVRDDLVNARLEITGAMSAVRAYDHVEQALAAIERMGGVHLTEPA